MPTFNPKPESELKTFDLLPEGDYDFEVMAATEKVSSNGNDMIALSLKCFSGSVETRVFDNLVFTDKAQWKIYSFAKAVGLAEKFKAGEINATDCEGKCGRLKLKVDKSEGYDDKNAVASYIEAKTAAAPLATVKKDDDNIPF